MSLTGGGRSLHSREGVLLYSTQSVQGTPVTPASYFGVVEYNADDDGDQRLFHTLGLDVLYKTKLGNAKMDWSVRLPAIDVKDALLLAMRDPTSRTLPWITWGFGSDPVDAAPEAWQVQDAKVGNFEVTFMGGGPVTGSLSGLGGAKTTSTSLVAAQNGKEPLMSYNCIFTVGGQAFENLEVRISGNYNLTAEYVNRGTAATSAQQRLFQYLTEGTGDFTGSARCARKYTKDFQALCNAVDGDLVIVCTPCAGGDAFTVTVPSIEFGKQSRVMPNSGYGHFELPFVGKGFSVA